MKNRITGIFRLNLKYRRFHAPVHSQEMLVINSSSCCILLAVFFNWRSVVVLTPWIPFLFSLLFGPFIYYKDIFTLVEGLLMTSLSTLYLDYTLPGAFITFHIRSFFCIFKRKKSLRYTLNWTCNKWFICDVTTIRDIDFYVIVKKLQCSLLCFI